MAGISGTGRAQRRRCLPLCPYGADREGKAQRPFERVAAPTGGRNAAWQPSRARGLSSRGAVSAAAQTGPRAAAQTGCAVSRTEGIATRGGRSSGSMTPRRTTDLDPKGRGDKSMLVKRGTAEDVYAVVLQRLSDRAKTGLFEFQSPGVEPHTRRQHI